MKFARVRTTDRPVVVSDGTAYDLSGLVGDLTPETLPSLTGLAPGAVDQLPEVDLSRVEFDAPVARVGAVIAIGLNYAAHAAESGAVPPAYPVMFCDVPEDPEHDRRAQ
jgi:2-keto-4-pentenoate hydratase/2-oxohepta-3-ene-1,7-dioic acid hydratase in catechol pathway